MKADASQPCELLEWDTAFFGFPIARVRGNSLAAAEVKKVEQWCGQRMVACLYFLCPAADVASAQTAEDAGFRLVDVRATLAAELDESVVLPTACTVRPSRDGDIDELISVARQSHIESRFYSDLHFPRHKATELYEEWLRKSHRGWAQQVLVAEVEGHSAGYITCHRDEDVGRIGLLAVGSKFRGHGVGYGLVRSAQRWFGAVGLKRVTVVTQGRNIGAQCLYQRCGFLTHDLAFWFHRWFSEPSPPNLEVAHHGQ